jgi:hypothetical protein
LDLDNYAAVAKVTVQHPPIISDLSLNDDADIMLVEGATTTIVASGTVTDLNGYGDISFATSTIYRTDIGANCTADENNCYQIPASQCALSSCVGNSCNFMCSAEIQYLADPTDTDSPHESTDWTATVATQDSTSLRDTESSLGVDLDTLYGLALDTSGIDFGSLAVGDDTGATDAQTTVVNTGNSNIDIQVSGTSLTDGSNTIDVGEQKYATTTFTYSTCDICQFLTGSATNVGADLAKPTATDTPVTDDVYWGIDIPSGTKATPHAGINTFMAVTGGKTRT